MRPRNIIAHDKRPRRRPQIAAQSRDRALRRCATQRRIQIAGRRGNAAERLDQTVRDDGRTAIGETAHRGVLAVVEKVGQIRAVDRKHGGIGIDVAVEKGDAVVDADQQRLDAGIDAVGKQLLTRFAQNAGLGGICGIRCNEVEFTLRLAISIQVGPVREKLVVEYRGCDVRTTRRILGGAIVCATDSGHGVLKGLEKKVLGAGENKGSSKVEDSVRSLQ